MNCLLFIAILAVPSILAQKLSTVLLAQAGEDILKSPFSPSPELARLEVPRATDLLISRLQAELTLRISDNWRSVTDPQRRNVLESKGAAGEILRTFHLLRTKVEELEYSINVEELQNTLNRVSLDSEDMSKWIKFWDNFKRKVGQIAQLYNYFKGYVDSPENTEDNTLRDFATSITKSTVAGRTMNSMLEDFHKTIVDENTFPYMGDILSKGGPHLCTLTQSPSQLLYNLYNIVGLTEIKGHAMLQFSYVMLNLYDKGNFTVEGEEAKNKFVSEAREKTESMMEVLPQMSMDYLKCEPDEYVAGENYLEVTKLLQGYIENEVDMNVRQSCQAECSAYTYADSKSCYKDLFCKKQPRCNGRIFDCQFFHADAWVCMSENSGERRYDWVEYEDGTLLGNKGECVNKIKVDSWWRWVFFHCSYCLCKCDEVSSDSDRFWSLHPVEANTQENKIVTGVRLVKRGRVIYPQIEEAVASAEGGVVEATRAWTEPATINTTDTDILLNNDTVFTMSYEQRAMDMDSLQAPPGNVLTGVKFRNLGGHLNMEIQITPIEFTTGKLKADRSIWIANDNTPATSNPRKFVPIIIPDVPTKYKGHNTVDTTTDQYIEFDASSAHKDVSQTTIPFIDSQPVAPRPGTWLGGAGLYHKGRVGFGGFVGIKVSTYDFSHHVVASEKTL